MGDHFRPGLPHYKPTSQPVPSHERIVALHPIRGLAQERAIRRPAGRQAPVREHPGREYLPAGEIVGRTIVIPAQQRAARTVGI